MQQPDGNIPWVPDGQTDPWNLVEAAMALDVGGRFAEAERAYEWLRRMQHPEGSWHAYYEGDAVKEHTLDTNVTCYVANGVWHHYLSTGDTGFLEDFFPMVERAIDFALDHQHPTGEIEWDADPQRGRRQGRAAHGIVEHLLVAALRDRRGGAPRARPPRLGAVARLSRRSRSHTAPSASSTRNAGRWTGTTRSSSGVLRGHAAEARVASRWDVFVAPGRGVRCVSDQPWITAAETCELVMALDAIGLHDRARELFGWVQFLRHDDGSYWTGMNFDDDRFHAPGDYYTPEQPTWNSAAVVLAANALGGNGPTAGLFRGEGLPAGLTAQELIDAGAEIESTRSRRDFR